MSMQTLKQGVRSAFLSPILCTSLLLPGTSLAETSPELAPQEETAEEPNQGQHPSVKSGDRVRVKTTLTDGRLKGFVHSLDDTQVTIMVEGGENVTVPWSAVKHLDVQVGQRRRGEWVPILAGAGALLGLAKPEHDTKTCVPFGGCRVDEAPSRGTQVAIGAGIGAVAGLIAVCSTPPSAPKWRRVRLPYRPSAATSLSLGITPGQDGVGARMVVVF